MAPGLGWSLEFIAAHPEAKGFGWSTFEVPAEGRGTIRVPVGAPHLTILWVTRPDTPGSEMRLEALRPVAPER